MDEYISHFPEGVQLLLQKVRNTIKASAPNASEVISYGMPAFKRNGILVWFAAFSAHIGLYPTASGIQAFRKELEKYKGGKGSIQFPFEKPIPFKLIGQIVKFRVVEDQLKIEKRKK
jgi:uncharacterized protein YdhG (YjbR/CyaY superfamily)